MTNKCIKCGCDNPYVSQPPSPTPPVCPNPQPCAEFFDARCVVYTGSLLACNEVTIVATNDTIAEALEQVIEYFCENGGPSTIVAAGANTTVTETTVGNTTTYTVASKEAIVQAGANVTVTSATVGYDTTYTVNAKESIVAAGTGVSVSAVTVGNDTTYTVNAGCPMNVEIVRAGVDPDYFQAQVTGGTAPYTYVWSLADTFNGDSTAPNNSLYLLAPTPGFPDLMWITINSSITSLFDACSTANTGRVGLLKVVVTDANGCKTKDFHFISSIVCG